MFKKTMTFDDLEGKPTTQTFYFNYTKMEVAEMLELDQLEEKIKRLTVPVEESGLSQVENARQAYETFQDLILKAYGVKGEDNVTFVKNDAHREYFKSHSAFPELIFEMLDNPSLAAEFMEKCLPAKLVAQAKAVSPSSTDITNMVEEAARRQEDPATRVEPGLAGLPDEVRTLSDEELTADLTPEDIREMDDIAFKKLNTRFLSREALLAAFQRKNT